MGSRALAATWVGRRPRSREPGHRGHVALKPDAGQVGPLGLHARACNCCRHVIQPHWVPLGHCEVLAVSILDLRRRSYCKTLAAEVWDSLALPLGTVDASHRARCKEALLTAALSCGRRGALYATRTGPCDAMRNCTQRIPGGTSLAVLHVHLRMCLQPWTHVARSSGTLSGAGLQPAGLKHALSGSMRLPDWRGSCCCCTSHPLP